MAKNLLIVESPAKAKTIQKYLGKDFVVKSSYGHIRDLDKGAKGVAIDDEFKPTYVVSPEKAKVVKELKSSSAKATEVWLATDEDREGEAISWHLCEVLGLDPLTTKRIVFSEITKSAIQSAVSQPRTVDIDLVNAQQARRILDRLVGFELSGTLWRKVKSKLSAGRVQSVAVKLIVERERAIMNFESAVYFKAVAIFDVKNSKGEKVALKADLTDRLKTLEEAETFVNNCAGANFSINSIEKKPAYRNPSAPFTTSTLQQEASRKLGFSVNRTMSTAQRLYEGGHITYMRTDSTTLSDLALNTIGEMIEDKFGSKYHHLRKHKSKSANAQEAHEAIRPTYIENMSISAVGDQQKLYELIWKRTVASQMARAELEKTTVDIGISKLPASTLRAQGEVLLFDGFLKVYMESVSEDDEKDDVQGMLPPMTVGQDLELNNLKSIQRFTQGPARYTEASLVKKLEELGIGRPSTYAPTITKIMEEARGYVTKESRDGKERKYEVITLQNDKISRETATEITGTTKNRLYSSDVGMIVTDFLDEHFDEIMEYSFTAGIEDKLDQVAQGTVDWKKMLEDFYFPFHKLIETTIETAERAKGKRILGKDPDSGHSVLVQITRFGPVVQIGDMEEMAEDEKPRFANLKNGQSMTTITYDEAMELFKLPKSFGDYKGEELIVNNGRYGPYVKLGEVYANIGRNEDPLELTLERAIEVIEAKLEENKPIAMHQDLPITKGKGRFGPFVKWNGLFCNVSKKYDFENLTVEEAIALVEAKIEKEANRYIQRWESEKIAIENGRWGPFIKFGKKNVKIPKVGDKKPEKEELLTTTLETVKGWIEDELPGSFKKKTKKAAPKKKAKPKAKTTKKK